MARFRKASLIGCFDGTGVTSENYKEMLYDQERPTNRQAIQDYLNENQHDGD